jgi:hypothetical protein
MMKRFYIGALLCTLAFTTSPAQGQSWKKLIAYGWHLPVTEELRKDTARYENTPFDGTAFNVFLRESSGRRKLLSQNVFNGVKLSYDQFQPAINDLRATRFKRLTENFVRVAVIPGTGIDWFDGIVTLIHNLQMVGRFVKDTGVRGVFLDLEPYQFDVWNYALQKNKARKSLEEYDWQAFQGGRNTIEALQHFIGRPFVLHLPFTYEMTVPRNSPQALNHRYSLLRAFLDGIMHHANSNVTVISGYCWSYGARQKNDYVRGYYDNKVLNTAASAYPERYKARTSAGFGLWLDFFWNQYGWNTTNHAANYFDPSEFQRSLTYALQRSDRYVWIYQQLPDFWNGTAFPNEYKQAMYSARQSAGLVR